MTGGEHEKIVNEIIKYYLSSGDFNGLPLKMLKDYQSDDIIQMIEEGMIEAISNQSNPHIKYFSQTRPIAEQIEAIANRNPYTCLYPTPKALKEYPKEPRKIYTVALQSGEGQFEVRFFDVAVLEQYFNNPQYTVLDLGYQGKITIKDEYYNDDSDYIQDYGMAYPKNGKMDRAIAVFIRDLSHLSEKTQMRWGSYEHSKQDEWSANGVFLKTLIYGEWISYSWIYDCLLEEQRIINQMCDCIGIHHIFTNTWGGVTDRPDGFRNILFPTKKNFYDFVNVLEKIVVNNISMKAFIQKQYNSNAVTHEDDEGTLDVLQKWLIQNGRNPEVVKSVIISPLKAIRKQRQIPAHEIIKNEYDKNVYKEQNELIQQAYWSMNCLRTMLSSHPLAKKVVIPDYLQDESKIVVY